MKKFITAFVLGATLLGSVPAADAGPVFRAGRAAVRGTLRVGAGVTRGTLRVGAGVVRGGARVVRGTARFVLGH